jgi:hypothetical protein
MLSPSSNTYNILLSSAKIITDGKSHEYEWGGTDPEGVESH